MSPLKKTYTVDSGSNTDTISVSDVNESVRVILNGEPGTSGEPTETANVNTFSGGGGSGARVVAQIDLSYYNNLRVECPHNKGNSGDDHWMADGGDGGDSVALYANGNRILVAGGGGGGAAAMTGSVDKEADGGDGGGPYGGSGGVADHTRAPSGGDGSVWNITGSTFEEAVTITSEEKHNENGKVVLFS